MSLFSLNIFILENIVTLYKNMLSILTYHWFFLLFKNQKIIIFKITVLIYNMVHTNKHKAYKRKFLRVTSDFFLECKRVLE